MAVIYTGPPTTTTLAGVSGPGELLSDISDGSLYMNTGTIAAPIWSPIVSTPGLSVKLYGAKGDGVTDDTPAFTAAFAAGNNVFVPPGTYIVTGITINTGQALIGSGRDVTILKLKANTAANVIQSFNWSTLTGTDNTTTPATFTIQDLTVDGNKANQSGAGGHGIALYARTYYLNNLKILNCKQRALSTEWATSSADPGSGLIAQAQNIWIFYPEQEGIYHRGPHDSQFDNFEIVKNSGNTYAAINLPVDGYSNGSVFQKIHVYGGNYTYGLQLISSGCHFADCQFEGAATAQVAVLISRNEIVDCKFFTGGVATTTAKGIIIGDGTHTNINNIVLRATVEECGGGSIDFTNAGAHHDIILHCFNTSAPASNVIGTVPTRSNIAIYDVVSTGDSTTAATQNNRAGSTLLTGVQDTNPVLKVTTNLTSQTKDMLYVTDKNTNRRFVVGPNGHVGMGSSAENSGINLLIQPEADQRAAVIAANASQTANIMEIDNSGFSQLWTLDKVGRPRTWTNTGIPTLAADAGLGTSPPALVLSRGNDVSGLVTFGTGTTPTTGSAVSVVYSQSWGSNPIPVIIAANAATAALQPFIFSTNSGGFHVGLGVAPAGSQANTTYSFYFYVQGF